jgi:hypothetical protein
MGQSLMVINIVLTVANIVIVAMNLLFAIERRRLERSREARAEYLAEQASRLARGRRLGLDGLSSRRLDDEASPFGKFRVG